MQGSKPSTTPLSKKQHAIAEGRQTKRNPNASAMVLEVKGSRPEQKSKPCSRELLDRAERSLEAACSAVENLVLQGRTSTGHDRAPWPLKCTGEHHEPPKAVSAVLEPRQESSKLLNATIRSSEDGHTSYTFGSGLTAIRFANGDVLQTQEGGEGFAMMYGLRPNRPKPQLLHNTTRCRFFTQGSSSTATVSRPVGRRATPLARRSCTMHQGW